MSKNPHLWVDRYQVLDDADLDTLDTDAAIHEFHQGMDRTSAEETAYSTYRRNKLLDGAAHHLGGMQAAQALGDTDTAGRHGELYDRYLQEVGLNLGGPIPSEVRERLDKAKAPKYRFRGHPADSWLSIPGTLSDSTL